MHRGGIFRESSAIGTAFGSGSRVGRKREFGGVFFNTLADGPDFEYVIVDGTIVRVHQHGTGAKGGLKIKRSGVHEVG